MVHNKLLVGKLMKIVSGKNNTRSDEAIIQSVKQWLETFVVGMNLCPFAKREVVNESVRFVSTRATSETKLLEALQAELELLNTDASIETTLLIHPQILQNFYDYNDFLLSTDDLLVKLNLEGVYQIASFHPNYQFAGTEPEDAENYTNRSPYPLLHLLREESLEQAIENFPSVDDIPTRNIALMNELGKDKLKILLNSCLK